MNFPLSSLLEEEPMQLGWTKMLIFSARYCITLRIRSILFAVSLLVLKSKINYSIGISGKEDLGCLERTNESFAKSFTGAFP